MLNKLDINDTQILFVDLQQSLVQGSVTVSPELLCRASGALGAAGHLLQLPMTFATVPEGKNSGPLISELRSYANSSNTFQRNMTDPFMVPEIAQAIASTERKTIILAGFSAEVAIVQSSLGGLNAGYTVYIPVDAIGSRSERTEAAAIREIEHAGCVTTSVRSLMMRLTPDVSKFPGRDMLKVLGTL